MYIGVYFTAAQHLHHLNINRNTLNSFPPIIDALMFYLQAEKTIKIDFCVRFDSETINPY